MQPSQLVRNLQHEEADNLDVESILTKENDEVCNKLQSIQSGKAFLEQKIQEYEARLQQMKTKKSKTRSCMLTEKSSPPKSIRFWANNI